MATIRTLFDPGRPIDRRIEKVIQFGTRREELLKKEVTEYIATGSIEEHFQRILSLLDEGMSGGEHEVGIWVSGFYGSGKSSFTKYLGLALDRSLAIEGRPFRDWLVDRFTTQQLKALVPAVAKKHPMTVVMLDLSTDALTGGVMLPVSTVLYYKVLAWAGYSQEKKIAYLELMLDRDGRRAEFERIVGELSGGEKWDDLHNDVMAAATYASRAASRLYPKLWATPQAFDALKIDEAETEEQRVQRMLDLVKRKTGSDNVLFLLDEVGQYVAPSDDRITNLQGLAQNLKRLGRGRAWIVATAQQTLTEDEERAALNTPKLFKLKDRFPIPVDLEASDIREICVRRLLGKSPAGQAALEARFAAHGEKLRLCTRLQDARGYSSELDRKSFVDLYPFLPHHFDILLKVLGRLAKSTGGVGLRSAIKVIQDALIDQSGGRRSLADQEEGRLAAAADLYEVLRNDIEKTFRFVVDGVRRAEAAYRDSPLHVRVARSVAVMQILDDFPLTRENLAALMHEKVEARSDLEEVRAAVDQLIAEPSVPLSEVDGKLRFMSEAVSELAQKRQAFAPGRSEERHILTDALTALFSPQPQARIYQTKTVGCGLKLVTAGLPANVFGDKEEIQVVLEYGGEAQLAARRKEHLAESLQAAARRTIFLDAVEDPALEGLVAEIFRSEKIAGANRGQSQGKEVDDYLTGQRQLAERKKVELATALRRGMLQGVFICHGRENAVRTKGPSLPEAVKVQLAATGEAIFEKYGHAPVQADGGLAERFIKARDLSAIAAADDPLSLAGHGGGQAAVNTAHPALVDLKDYLDINGTVDGKKLLDDFSRSPFGWSKDTTRYLAAALLAAGEIKLRVNNRDITVRGEAAAEVLKSVAGFNRAGVSLRDNQPDPQALLKARQRLLELTGEEVSPLEDRIAEAVYRSFPAIQTDVAPLPLQLATLGLPGEEKARRLQERIQDLLSDSAEIVRHLGAPDCELYDDLLWARQVLDALGGGADATLRAAQEYRKAIPALPDLPALVELKEATEEQRIMLAELLELESFFDRLPDIQGGVSQIREKVKQAAEGMEKALADSVREAREKLEADPDWPRLGEEDRVRLLAQVDLPIAVARDLPGISKAITDQYMALMRVEQVRQQMRDRLRELQPVDDGPAPARIPGKVRLPRTIATVQALDATVNALQEARPRVQAGGAVELELE